MNTKKYSINIDIKLDIALETLIGLCYQHRSRLENSIWIKSIEILEPLGKSEDLYELQTKVRIVNKSDFEDDKIITLGDILKAIQKISSRKINVSKYHSYKIFNAYHMCDWKDLDAHTDDCILQVATFGKIQYG